MRLLAMKVLRHAGTLVFCGLFVVGIFIILVAINDANGFCSASIQHGIVATLTLLMDMDTPAGVLEKDQTWMLVFGWVICLMGWLILPLIIGCFIDISLNQVASHSKLQMLLEDFAASAGLEGGDTKKFARDMLKRVDNMLTERKE